jgi:transketolase
VFEVINAMMQYQGPSYLRLGFGIVPTSIGKPLYSAIRKIDSGDQLTIIGLGPIILNALEALKLQNEDSIADVFVVSEMPLLEISQEFLKSILKTKKLIIIEEHVSRGGLGENLALLLLKNQVICEVVHRYALGYPNGLYGSQSYHHKICSLDANSLLIDIQNLIQN